MKTLLYVLVLFALLFSMMGPTHAQWVQTSRPPNVVTTCLAVSGDYLFAGTMDGVYRSTDYGDTWTKVGLEYYIVSSLAVSSNIIFAGTMGSGVFLSTDNGTTWTQSGLASGYIHAFAIMGTDIFAAGGGIFRSTDNGATWLNTGMRSDADVRALAVSGPYLFAGLNGSGVHLSTDSGASWTAVNGSGYNGITYPVIRSLAIMGNNLFAGVLQYGAFHSTNNGATWRPIRGGFGIYDVLTFAVSGNNLFAGGGQGIYVTSNQGDSWTEVNSGLTQLQINALVVSGSYLLAGGISVWRRPLSDMISSVEDNPLKLNSQPSLYQNYPNPFKASTKISFTLPAESFVELKVFNALGTEVAVLVSKQLPAGEYSTQWDPSGLPGGVYYYRLNTGQITHTRSLILLP